MAIEAGSIVRLNTGGPEMSVQSVEGGMADCAWFDKSIFTTDLFPVREPAKLRREAFAVASLVPVDREAEVQKAEKDSRALGKFAVSKWSGVTLLPVDEAGRAELPADLQRSPE